MEDLNLVVMTGRLGKDPETKTSKEGKIQAKISIAVNRGGKKEDEKKEPYWFDCRAYGLTAEFIKKYLTKGTWVEVVGKMRNWKDTRPASEGGTGKTYYEIIVDRIWQLSWEDKAEAVPARSESKGQGQEAPPMPDPNEPTPGPDDGTDVPF